MPEIIPAILPKSFAELEEKVGLVKGLVDSVQVDICDGKFVPNTTWPFMGTRNETERSQHGTDAEKSPLTKGVPPTFSEKWGAGVVKSSGLADSSTSFRKGGIDEDFAELLAEKKGLPFWDELDYEFDLMVAEPQEVIADFVRLGASRVIVHVEAFQTTPLNPPFERGEGEGTSPPILGGDRRGGDFLSDLIHEWKDAIELGLALNPSTPLSAVETFLHEVRLVQCMGNDRLGFQGTPLDEARVLPKLAELRERYPNLDIAVDIGVNPETAPRLIAAGANRLVAGSAIFGSGNVQGAIRRFKSLLSYPA